MVCAHLCNRVLPLTLTLTINEMKRFCKKLFRSKKPSLGSIHRYGVATSTSTLITGTADLMPSIYASDVTASTQVTTAGISVSVQLRSSHL